MAATTLIVKITLGTEIRRFTSNSETLSWASLSKRVVELFGLGASKTFKMTYTDDENDRITLSSDEELAEAASLALSLSPAVLRLTVLVGDDKPAPKDTPKRDAGTHAKPATADAATTDGTPGTPGGTAGLDASLAGFLHTLAKQLPAVAAQMPEGVRALLPHAELDVAATIAANAADNASCIAADARRAAEAAAGVAAGVATAAAAAATCPFAPGCHVPMADEPAVPGVHSGVTCDKSGQCPIVGNRYHLVGHNYDLCEAEWQKLDDKEKALFCKVPPPPPPPPPVDLSNNTANNTGANNTGANPGANNTANPGGHAGSHFKDAVAKGVHPGVECDRSGMCPIVGMRYQLRGHNYDLCQAEYDKLGEEEKANFVALPPPVTHPAHVAAAALANAAGSWRDAAEAWRSGAWSADGRSGAWAKAWGGPAGHCPWRGRGHRVGGGPPAHPPNGGGGPKLAARFVRDVSIFDGTQMAGGTAFTKIWRLKNVGEVPWPAGTRMLFVGGDQMGASEMCVPLSRAGPVLPGEEVDVAVEMVAPKEVGRYLGYWRLIGPQCRRKFGQRVWCHIQVVDETEGDSAAALPLKEDELAKTIEAIEQHKSQLTAAEADEADDEDKDEDKAPEDTPRTAADVAPTAGDGEGRAEAEATAALEAMAVDEAHPVVGMPIEMETEPPPHTDAEDEKLSTRSDDELVVVEHSTEGLGTEGLGTESLGTEGLGASTATKMLEDNASFVYNEKHQAWMPKSANPDEWAQQNLGAPSQGTLGKESLGKEGLGGAPPSSAASPASPVDGVRAQLLAMGFHDETMLEAVLAKHGEDVEACARDLAAASEWEALLGDLCEMGFHDVEKNKVLMLKHAGNIKRTVKELVEEA